MTFPCILATNYFSRSVWFLPKSASPSSVYAICVRFRSIPMKIYQIAMLVVYILGIMTMIVMKSFNMGSRRRGVVKMICSALFVAMAVAKTIGSTQQYKIIALVGVIFAALGDFFLVFMDSHKLFVCGVLSFSVASLCFSVYTSLSFDWRWWFIVVFVLFIAAIVAGQITKIISFGRSVVCLNIYTVLVALCGCLGLTVLAHGTANMHAFLFGLGSFMYFASDIVLGLYLYKFRNPVMDCINTALYFPGLMLIALAL